LIQNINDLHIDFVLIVES